MESLLIQGKRRPMLIAISGVKNSGKTTLIEKLIPRLKNFGYKVATIKHDGHDFDPDVENRDTYRHKKAGAYGTAIFSESKFMIVKEEKQVSEEDLISYFKEADIILLEGFKNSNYPKIEIIRKGNSDKSVCKKETLIALVTDLDLKESEIKEYEVKEEEVKIINLNDIDEIAKELNEYVRRCEID